MRVRLLFPLLFGLLVACGEEPQRIPVSPLDSDAEKLQSLYKWGPGPHPVEKVEGLALPRSQREDSLVYNAYYPLSAGEKPWPLLLFSHGNWSNNDKYDRLIRHWVSHGYVVLAPLHLDANGGYLSSTLNLVRYGNLGLIQAREGDLVALLDALPQVEQQVPALAGRIDHSRIAATGHSFGAFNAQQLGGARAYDADAGEFVGVADARIRAVVAISPPGPMFDEITAGSWAGQAVPTLMSTGTWDSDGVFWMDWRDHLISFKTSQPGEQFALVVQGADHYYGNLICRPELEVLPQEDALALTNTTVVAFLDAYLKQSAEALAWLRGEQLQAVSGGFAVIERR